MTPRNYIGALLKEDNDIEQAGVKGMRWGFRNDKSLKSGAASKNPAAKKAGPETSADRYTRLLAQAKKDGANTFSEEELRFVTQRGNAISQVERLNSTKPNWIADASKQALKQVVNQSLKTVAANASKKYITSQLVK